MPDIREFANSWTDDQFGVQAPSRSPREKALGGVGRLFGDNLELVRRDGRGLAPRLEAGVSRGVRLGEFVEGFLLVPLLLRGRTLLAESESTPAGMRLADGRGVA